MYRRPKYIIKHEITLPVSFHDTDAMGVVWHGNYIKFFELAREALFNKIGFGYDRMQKLNVICPISDCQCSYRNYIQLTDKEITISAMLTDYTPKITVHYEVSAKGRKICAYGYTHQVMVDAKNMELMFEPPKEYTDAVEKAKALSGEYDD